jgi:hypothetical protein
LEKRKYFKGYYIGKRHHLESNKFNFFDEKKSFPLFQQSKINLFHPPSSEDVIYSSKSNISYQNTYNQLIVKPKKKNNSNDTCKDELVFKNGERLKVKIIEIMPNVVRFYNCTLGSAYVSEVPKNDLSLILPHEGKAEFIDSASNSNSKKTNNVAGCETKIHEEVLIGVALFAILWLVGVPYILIRYKPVRNEILSNPDKYHGKKLWDVLFYFALAYIVIALLYIFIIYIFFFL